MLTAGISTPNRNVTHHSHQTGVLSPNRNVTHQTGIYTPNRDTILPTGGGPDHKSPVHIAKGQKYVFPVPLLEFRNTFSSSTFFPYLLTYFIHIYALIVLLRSQHKLNHSRLSFPSYVLHRRKEIYGPDANDFRPDRWADPNSRPGWAYVPFNGGPRICVGQQFALIEAGSTIVRLTQTFRAVEQRDETPYEECIRISLSVFGGVKVGMIPR